MVASARATIGAFNLKPGEKVLLCLEVSHIAGMMMVVRAITGQLDLIAVQPSANPFESIGEENQPAFAALVPYQLQHILRNSRSGRDRLEKLRVLLLGGAPLDPPLENAIMGLKPAVFIGFGMTETVSHIALRRLNGPGATREYRSLPGIDLKTDSRGCLGIRGAVTANRWIWTNDVVELTSPVTFIWKGRADHVINSGGIKIYPEEIEKRIAVYFKKKGIKSNFFITGMKDPDWGEKLCLVVEGRPRENDWIRELKKRLPAYMDPKEVIFIENFAYTDSGKLQRSETVEKLPSIQKDSNNI